MASGREECSGYSPGKRANFQGLDLSRLDLSNKVLDQAIFSGTILEYTNFTNTHSKTLFL